LKRVLVIRGTAISVQQIFDVAGEQVGMPAEVRDASAGTVSFEVGTQGARLLPVPEEFELVETTPGRGTAGRSPLPVPPVQALPSLLPSPLLPKYLNINFSILMLPEN
jgi:hypothetical protein